jgi:hypothetical protein
MRGPCDDGSLLLGPAWSLTACGDSMKAPPQVIDADGQTFVCVRDRQRLHRQREFTLRVKFTDANGLSHVIKGIRKLHVSQLPKSTKACQPPTP